MRYLSSVIILFLATSCFVSDELPPDQKAWEYTFPSQVGLDNQQLTVLDELVKGQNYGQIDGLVIIKDDQLVFENYYNGDNRQTLHQLGRSTCAVAVLTLGKLIEDGYISDLDVPIFNFLPEYQTIFDAEPDKKAITFRHILNNRMGIPWNEYTVNVEASTSHVLQMKLESDWARHIISRKLEAPPGLRLVLNSGSAILLSKVFSNILQDQTLEEYIKTNLFDPIGISSYEWAYDPSGTLDLFSGLSLSVLDFTRIGYLMQQEGRWSDRRRVINRDWVLDATLPSVDFINSFNFGYYWWVFTDDFADFYLSRNQTYMMNGFIGQNLYVSPDNNLVVCVMGENYFNDLIYSPSLEIYRQTLIALNAVPDTP